MHLAILSLALVFKLKRHSLRFYWFTLYCILASPDHAQASPIKINKCMHIFYKYVHLEFKYVIVIGIFAVVKIYGIYKENQKDETV
jgi:hypothetical protein